jgi:hypothetical protein
MTSKSVLSTVLFSTALALGGTSIARADVLPPGAEDCGDYGSPATVDLSRVNKSCQLFNDQTGICVPAKCSQHDYAHWDRDASPHGPPSLEYDCLACTPEHDDAAAADPKANASATNATNTKNGSGGCSISGGARTAAPWFLAIAAALVVSGVRRRRSAQ